MSVAFGWGALGQPETRDGDPTVTGLPYGTVSAEASGVGEGDSVQTIDGAARSGIHAVCSDNQTALRLQTGGDFRPAQVPTAAPVQFPPGVFTGSSLDVANALGDPTQGPGGDRSNLAPPGPAGSWCRPLPEPFAQDNPLASRAFWTPFALLLVIVVVFLLSRGVKIPA